MTYFETHYPVTLGNFVDSLVALVSEWFSSEEPEVVAEEDSVVEDSTVSEPVVSEDPAEEGGDTTVETTYVDGEVSEINMTPNATVKKKPYFEEVKVHPEPPVYLNTDWSIDMDTGVPTVIPVRALRVEHVDTEESSRPTTMSGFLKLRNQLTELFEVKDLQKQIHGFKRFVTRVNKFSAAHGIQVHTQFEVESDMFRAVTGNARLNLIRLTCEDYLLKMRSRKASTIELVCGFASLYTQIEVQLN